MGASDPRSWGIQCEREMGKEDKIRLCGEGMDWLKVSALFDSVLKSFCQLETRLATLGLTG